MGFMHHIIDWNELWKATYTSHGQRHKNSDPGKVWDKKAAYYDLESAGAGQGAPEDLNLAEIRQGETVLDVGAGTGRLAVPIAVIAGHVTALDPSEKMLAYLRRKMEAAGRKNYSCIRMRWEDAIIGVNVEPHDVVIASYSLGFYDVGAALAAIDAAALRCAYLFWHAGEWRTSGEKALWDEVFDAESLRKGYPDYIYLVNILHQMEIYANVRIYTTEEAVHYASPEEAAERWMKLHDAPAGKECVVLEHFSRMLTPAPDGGYIHRRCRRNAAVWWEKG